MTLPIMQARAYARAKHDVEESPKHKDARPPTGPMVDRVFEVYAYHTQRAGRRG